MSGLFAKLNLKDEREILVIDAPASFESQLATLDDVVVRRKASGKTASFVLVFATSSAQVAAAARLIGSTTGDVKLWMAYPKQSSKRVVCAFNRDTGWAALGAAGLEPVRQVAIDDDWSALRFRRVDFIRTLRRAKRRAISSAGKRRGR